MRRLVIPFVFLAVSALSQAADIAASTGVQQSALVVKDTRFSAGIQLHTTLEPSVSLVLSPQWRLDGSIGIGHVTQSPLTLDGVTYRGMTTRTGGIGVAAILADSRGVHAGIELTLASYTGTSLLFFYPSITAGPLIQVRLSERYLSEWTLVLGYHLRQDLITESQSTGSFLERLPIAFSLGLRSKLIVDFPAP